MLSKAEENDLEFHLRNLDASFSHGFHDPIIPNETAYRIIKMLLEVNKECSRYANELQKVNEDFAAFRQHYEGDW